MKRVPGENHIGETFPSSNLDQCYHAISREALRFYYFGQITEPLLLAKDDLLVP